MDNNKKKKDKLIITTTQLSDIQHGVASPAVETEIKKIINQSTEKESEFDVEIVQLGQKNDSNTQQ